MPTLKKLQFYLKQLFLTGDKMNIKEMLIAASLVVSITGCNILENSEDNPKANSSVTFDHSMNSVVKRSLDFDNAPFVIDGTPAVLTGTNIGPFDFASRTLHFSVEHTDSEGVFTHMPVVLDETIGLDPNTITLTEVVTHLNTFLSPNFSVSESPFTITPTMENPNGGTMLLSPMFEDGITLAQLGFEENNRLTQGVADIPSSDYLFTGTMDVQPIGGGTAMSIPWSVYLDQETFLVQSNNAITLEAGDYDFSLIVSKSGVQYAGTAQATVAQGSNNFAMTLTPVVGEQNISATHSDSSLLSTLTRYEIEYLDAAPHQELGVSINGAPEQLISFTQIIDPVGFYLDLDAGLQQITLNLYDGPNLIGTSKTLQENQTVVAGQTINMDIVPIAGVAEFTMSEGGGTADVIMNIPPSIISEVGDELNLAGTLSLIGDTNSIIATPFTVSAGNANFTLSDVQYGDATLSLQFIEIDTGDVVAVCADSVTLSSNTNFLSCDFNVRARALLEGQLLSYVGLTVLTFDGEPANGATIRDENANVIGITGTSEFGTPGFVNLELPQGPHNLDIMSSDEQSFMFLPLNLILLDVSNESVTLPPAP